MTAAEHQVQRLSRAGRALSRSDLRIIFTAQLVRVLSNCDAADDPLRSLDAYATAIDRALDQLTQ
jgi:hypothetical protein